MSHHNDHDKKENEYIPTNEAILTTRVDTRVGEPEQNYNPSPNPMYENIDVRREEYKQVDRNPEINVIEIRENVEYPTINDINKQHYNPIIIPVREARENQVIIVQNQIDLKEYAGILRSSPEKITCPYCLFVGHTEVKTELSIANLLCCIFTDPIVWCLFQCCRDKDLNCCDATHRCHNCKRIIRKYEAC